MLPHLPTDSIYKFLALSGLVTTGFCLWLSWSLLTEMAKNERLVRNEYIGLIGDIETEYGQTESKDDSRIKFHIFLNDGTDDDPTRIELDELLVGDTPPYLHLEENQSEHFRRIATLDKFFAQALTFRGDHPIANDVSKLHTIRTRLREHSLAAESFGQLHHQLEILMSFILGGIIIGVALTLIGFWHWYFHVQLLQDELMKLQLQHAKKELHLNELH